jgi:hypothetical protein
MNMANEKGHITLQSKQTTIKHVFNITSAKFCQEIMSLYSPDVCWKPLYAAARLNHSQ